MAVREPATSEGAGGLLGLPEAVKELAVDGGKPRDCGMEADAVTVGGCNSDRLSCDFDDMGLGHGSPFGADFGRLMDCENVGDGRDLAELRKLIFQNGRAKRSDRAVIAGHGQVSWSGPRGGTSLRGALAFDDAAQAADSNHRGSDDATMTYYLHGSDGVSI
jgi:hypothetical protein